MPSSLVERQTGPPSSDSERPVAGESVLEWLGSPALPRFVTRAARQYGLSAQDIPDLLQETRIALWEAGSTAKVSAAWVMRVASNKSVDLLRRTSRAGARERAFTETCAGRASDFDLERLLGARVARLPPRLRRFYDLRYRQGRSERDVAARLQVCRASVRWLDHRCRTLLIGVDPGSRGASA